MRVVALVLILAAPLTLAACAGGGGPPKPNKRQSPVAPVGQGAGAARCFGLLKRGVMDCALPLLVVRLADVVTPHAR